MFNFRKLKVVTAGNSGSNSSFVGIRRGFSGELEFNLPKGFDSFPNGDFNETKKLFFRMYKTFKHFDNDREKKEIDKKPTGKDNIETDGRAYTFKDNEDNDVIIYSKISLIEKMLDAYRDLSMDFIEKSIGKSDQIDYKRLDQYLDKAIYLDNDLIFIDEMDVPRYLIHYQSNSLITLFCFIIRELEKELGNFIDSRINELADFFAAHNLSPDQSLFEESSFESTITALKDILHEIDKNTPYKDDKYWRLFEAIESFLYGELNMEAVYDDGVFWGINNFFQIWEDMCNTYAFSNFSILFADTNITYMGSRVGNHNLNSYHKVYKHKDLDYPFYINFRKQKRWIRPDLVEIIYSQQETIFSTAIGIEILRTFNNNMINFDVRLLDKSKESLYKEFCDNLSKAHGSRKKIGKSGVTSFINYFPQKLEMHKKRLLAKHQLNSTSTPTKVRIIDWKYMELNDFYDKNPKVEMDVTKQLCYEFCLSKLKLGKSNNQPIQEIQSIFVIPRFNNKENQSNDLNEISDYANVAKSITSNKIRIYTIDFSVVQEAYIKND